jgi:methanogenic corrinoid protein MtbC1
MNDHHRHSFFTPADARETLRERLALILERHMPTQLNVIYEDAARTGFTGGFAHQKADASDIGDLAEAFIAAQPGGFLAELERLGLDALPFREFLTEVVEPMMRALGDMWCDDKANFLAVSIATERLRLAIDTLHPDEDFALAPGAPTMVVTCHNAAHHNFGAFLLGKAFASAGWLVENRLWNDPAGSPLALAARKPVDLFALSIGLPSDAGGVKATIARLRAEARNPRMLIAIGGMGPQLEPEAFEGIGADFFANDAFGAVAKAQGALARSRTAAAPFARQMADA